MIHEQADENDLQQEIDDLKKKFRRTLQHKQSDLSEVLALARKRGRGSEGGTNARAPNDAEQRAHDKLTGKAADGDARE